MEFQSLLHMYLAGLFALIICGASACSRDAEKDDGQSVRQSTSDLVSNNGSLSGNHAPLFDMDLVQGDDALQMLQDACGVASKQGKNVFIQMGGPGCPPCVAMSEFLDRHRDKLSNDYVFVRLDRRMGNFDEVWASYGAGTWSVPWISIIAPSGIPLADSSCDGRNIGYPNSEKRKQHFGNMIAKTSTTLSTADIYSIVSDISSQVR